MSARPASSRESCVECGEGTAVGSALYSDRRRIDGPDGATLYICSICVGRMRMDHGGAPVTDEQLRLFLENASMAEIRWGYPFSH